MKFDLICFIEIRPFHPLSLITTIFQFLTIMRRRPLKTLSEKEKMLVTSIFSFSNNVFYPMKEKNYHFSNKKPFKNIVGKGENACKLHFSSSLKVFSSSHNDFFFFTFSKPHIKFFIHIHFCRQRMLSICTRTKFCRLVKG